MSISYNKAAIASISETNTISKSFKEFEAEVEEKYATNDSVNEFRNRVKNKYATKDSVKTLRQYTKGQIGRLKDDVKMTNEVINKVYDIVSNPALTGYKQSWKDLKIYLISMRDVFYVSKARFEDKCTHNIFYKFFHYKEYKEYRKDLALFNYTQTLLGRLESLEKENMIIVNEDECNE